MIDHLLKTSGAPSNFVEKCIIDSYFKIEGSSIGNFSKQAANLKINKINFVG